MNPNAANTYDNAESMTWIVPTIVDGQGLLCASRLRRRQVVYTASPLFVVATATTKQDFGLS